MSEEGQGINFAARLKFLMNKYGLMQADLCRRTGIERSLMSNYYKGKARPTLDNAIALAKAFGITLDELVGFEPKTPLSEREEELLDMFRELSDDEQREILGYTEYKHAKKFLQEQSSKEAGKKFKSA